MTKPDDERFRVRPRPPRARDARRLSTFLGRVQVVHWVSGEPLFSPDGKMAYMPGVDEMTVPGPRGEIMTVHMRGISIWRRDPDGEWRCVVDIANESPPA